MLRVCFDNSKESLQVRIRCLRVGCEEKIDRGAEATRGRNGNSGDVRGVCTYRSYQEKPSEGIMALLKGCVDF